VLKKPAYLISRFFYSYQPSTTYTKLNGAHDRLAPPLSKGRLGGVIICRFNSLNWYYLLLISANKDWRSVVAIRAPGMVTNFAAAKDPNRPAVAQSRPLVIPYNTPPA
jgi:hypothetical protein